MVCTKDVNYANRMIQKLKTRQLFLIPIFTKPIRTETSNFNCNPYEIFRNCTVETGDRLQFPFNFIYDMVLKSMLCLFWLTLLCKSLKLKVSSCSWTNDVLFLAPFKFHATLKFTILLCLFFHSKMGFITIVKMKNASFRIVQFCVLIFYCS